MFDLRPFLRRCQRVFFRSKLSRLFALLMSRKARHLYQRVVEDVGPLPLGSRIADIGCGHGTFLAMYVEKYPQVIGYGLDQSAELIRFARKQCQWLAGEVEFEVGDVHEAPLPAEAFDVVVSCSSIYCWHNPVLALDQIYASLKPGGLLIIYDELPVRSFRQAMRALFDQRLYGLGLPAYTEDELRDFAARSKLGQVEIQRDHMIIRLTLLRPPERPGRQ